MLMGVGSFRRGGVSEWMPTYFGRKASTGIERGVTDFPMTVGKNVVDLLKCCSDSRVCVCATSLSQDGWTVFICYSVDISV